MKFVSILKGLITSLFLILASSPLTAEGTNKQNTLSNPATWQFTELKDNKLVGKIWSKEKQDFITPAELIEAIKDKRFVLLGEIHDNADHHLLQAAIINELSQKQEKPALVLEMIKVDQMQRFNGYRNQPNSKAKHLGTALRWKQNGWPDWSIYLPIGEQIFKHNLEVYPGHTTRLMIDHLIKSDMSILPEKAKKTFKLDVELEKSLKDALSEEIKVAHCNHLPEHIIPPMTEVQRFRDAWMADVLIQASYNKEEKRRQAILIAGNGHTRTDRGVPWYLNLREGKDKSVTVQFTEVTKDAKDIGDVAQKSPAGKIAADFVWVTPTKTRGDQCSRMFNIIKNKK